jgi:hypothetical protein
MALEKNSVKKFVRCDNFLLKGSPGVVSTTSLYIKFDNSAGIIHHTGWSEQLLDIYRILNGPIIYSSLS